MRERMAMLAVALGLASPAGAQEAAAPRSAEQFLETAREVYSIEQPEPDPCPQATNAEIVVCKPYAEDESQRLPSPTERALAAGEMPPDPVPNAPNVFGLPPCRAYAFCAKVGRAPPPIHVIDFSAIPEALTPEEAALVFRAEDLAPEPSPEAASPAEAP